MDLSPALAADQSAGAGGSVRAARTRAPWSRWVALWALFFAIGGGLGYPILNRYDPTMTPGIGDVFSYGQIITERPGLSGRNSYRVLQPMVGKPIYWLVENGFGPWRPVSVALLVSAAAFLATTLALLVLLGTRCIRDRAVWMLAPLLYVCTFWVPNGMLAGLVDASEACVLTLLAWTLLTRRWWLLPLVGVIGGLAKETFVPLSAVFAGTWWLVICGTQRRREWRAMAGIAAMALLALAMPTLVRLAVDSQVVWPWMIGAQLKSQATLAARARQLFFDPGLYYPFVWLGPLAAWSWRRIPPPWLAGALASAGTAVALALYANAGGSNAGRPMFNVLGGPLSLAAATTLLRLAAHLGARPGPPSPVGTVGPVT